MTEAVEKILDKVGLPADGWYENGFYVILLENSNEYAKYYTKLEKNAVNTEFPSMESQPGGEVSKMVNYFELTVDSTVYNIFLMADFSKNVYKVKIGTAE